MSSLPVTQGDSVEGVKGGKVLLTLHFVKAEFMLAFIRDANDSRSVTDSINLLHKQLGPDMLRQLIPILLCDNESEFTNPQALESDEYGSNRTQVFYCDPSAPHQRGSGERNHEFIRLFIPKGASMDHLTQDDVTLMMDNINSYGRKILGDKSPYEMMAFLYGKKILNDLGCKRIPPNEVVLNATIFRKQAPVDSNA